jgi:hypothetical protein
MAFSTLSTISRLAPYNKLNVPRNLQYISSTDTTITFSFTPPTGTPTSYTPYVNGSVATGSGTPSSYTVNVASAGTYSISISATYGSTTTAQSNAVSMTVAVQPFLYYKFDSADRSNLTVKNYGTGLYDLTITSTAGITQTTYKFGDGSLWIPSSSYFATYTTSLTLPIAITGNGYSVCFWGKLSSSMLEGYLYSYMGWATGGVVTTQMHIQVIGSSSNQLQIFFTPNGATNSIYFTTYTKPSGNFLDDTWHHICLTIQYTNSTTIQGNIYFDGVSVVSQSNIPNAAQFTITLIEIGHRTDGRDDYINGYIDDFRLYKVPLTSTQVQAIYNGTM